VAEEVCAFVRFELLQGIGCGSLESVEGSRSGLAHMRLELGKGIFDRIEIWTVGRPIVEFGAAAGRDRWSTLPLLETIEQLLQTQYSGEGKSKVGSKHRKDVGHRLAAFLLFTGEKAVRDVTRDDLKSYREVLDQLPDRFELRFKTKDMRTAIEKSGQRKTPQASIGPTTVDLKWLGPVNHLFQWLVLEEKVEKNPVDGIRSKQDAGDAANTKRLPFKPDQISKLFAITSTDSPKTALYWLPLLLLTTGARSNELAQLQTDDLHLSFNGRPHLNLLCLLDDDDEAANPTEKAEVENDPRRVKTAAGRRMIPLHSILIKAGFIQLVEGRHNGKAKQLFRELHSDQHGFWSSAITKRLSPAPVIPSDQADFPDTAMG
jgi:integrase